MLPIIKQDQRDSRVWFASVLNNSIDQLLDTLSKSHIYSYTGWVKKIMPKILLRITKIKGKFWQKAFYTLYYNLLSFCRP